MNENIFDADEMMLRNVDPNWTADELLSAQGIFFLKDIGDILDIDTDKIKKEARRLNSAGKNAWETIGAKKIWNHWIVRMSVFALYYQKKLVSKIRKIPPEWDGNRLLKEKGLFLMTEVCKYIPFSTHQIRYQVERTANAREELGVWKDEELNTFVVQMELFSVWVRWLLNKNKEG